MSDLLKKIHTVNDLRLLKEEDMPLLAQEIREFLISQVKETGGHLASNLGVVELSLAIHRVFDTPHDQVIWDVGHQTYVHKLLTGRKDRFDTLRTVGGLGGFPKREESEFDPFGTGHSSTAISAALGFAHANRLQNNGRHAVCVVGDGALTGGLSHEGINNCPPDLPLVIIINENEMSISKVTGAFPKLMSRIRVSRKYRKMKKGTKRVLVKIPLIGKPIVKCFSACKAALRHRFYRANYFEEMGVSYMGPCDGHDYNKVKFILEEAKNKNKTVVVHLRTTKGKGYQPAEEYPSGFHCVYPAASEEKTFHAVAGDWLLKKGKDERLVCITPATGDTTGLTQFAKAYPTRYFDVGIAESHALTFAAGLAAAGMKPYAVVYSSFLQRAYDQILHDVALQNLPVRMLIDRASLAPADGPTHHGIYDVALLSEMPNVRQYAPLTLGSLIKILEDTENAPYPVSIRYPNGGEDMAVKEAFYPQEGDTHYGLRVSGDLSKADGVILTYGKLTSEALRAQELLAQKKITVAVCALETLTPLREVIAPLLSHLGNQKPLVVMEEGILAGGIGMQISHLLGQNVPHRVLAIENGLLVPEGPTSLYAYHHIAAEDAVLAMENLLSSL